MAAGNDRPSGSAAGMAWGQWLAGQAIAAAGLTGLLWIGSPVWAYSGLLGFLAVAVPAGLFALRVLGHIGGSSATFLRHAVVGEVIKLGLTGMLCALVFINVRPLAAAAFFLGMAVAMAVGWSGLARRL